MDYEPEGGIYSGNLLLDVLDDNGLKTGERDVGNTRNFTFPAAEIETKEKIGKRNENFGQSIEETIMKNVQKVAFTLDDISKDNLALKLFGAAVADTQSASSASDEAVVARHDKWVKLAKRNLKSTPAVVVTNSAGTVTYDIDVDYEINYFTGMIRALSTGAITDEQDLLVDYSYDAYTGYNIAANTLTRINCHLRLIGKNIVTGDDVEVLVYKASLKPTGPVDWITEDYGTLEFEGTIQATVDGTYKVLVI